MPDNKQQPSQPAQPGISMRVVFVLVVLTLVVATAASVLIIVNKSAKTSINELLREKAEIVSYAIFERVRDNLNPVAAHAQFTAQIIAESNIGEMRDEEIGSLLYTSLSAMPQISSVSLIDRNVHLIRAFRNRPSMKWSRHDWSDDPEFSQMIRTAWSAETPYWGPLFYAESSGSTLLNYVSPIRKDNRTLYVLVSSVSLSDLSSFVSSLQNEMTGRAFILLGEDNILAYSAMPEKNLNLNDDNPLPTLSAFSDAPISKIWSPSRRQEIETDLSNGIEARVVDDITNTYVFLFRRADGLGDTQWIVGSHFELDRLAPQLARSRSTLLFSFIVIFVSTLVALFLSRIVSSPIRRLSFSANRIKDWDFAHMPGPSKSLFREINEANSAFDQAQRACESLQAYVPETLAKRLIKQDDGSVIKSEEHTISILFTDIVDFTGMAEERSPKEVVDFLNAHFTLLAQCIETEHGIVDKFIGDSSMAFWGGLESDRDHASHACRTALRIEEAMHHENGVRRANGRQPIKLRIGIHSGKAMLGNIGSPGRVNYTVIGDAVNTAQRLERLAREVGGGAPEVFTLISGETAVQLGPSFTISPIGRKVLRGRHEETEVFILKSGQTPFTTEAAD